MVQNLDSFIVDLVTVESDNILKQCYKTVSVNVVFVWQLLNPVTMQLSKKIFCRPKKCRLKLQLDLALV